MITEIKREIWNIVGDNLEYNMNDMNDLLSLLDKGLRNTVGVDAQVEYLEAVASLWMPKVCGLAGTLEYGTPEYNTREAFCLAVKSFLRSR